MKITLFTPPIQGVTSTIRSVVSEKLWPRPLIWNGRGASRRCFAREPGDAAARVEAHYNYKWFLAGSTPYYFGFQGYRREVLQRLNYSAHRDFPFPIHYKSTDVTQTYDRGSPELPDFQRSLRDTNKFAKFS